MSAFSTLLALINAQIKTNGLKAITGAKLNGVLVQMVNELGSGYQFIDIATPATDPGTPDENVWYIASQAGTYTNFGGIIVNENEVCALVWNGSWTKKVTGAATAAQVSQLGQFTSSFVDVSQYDAGLRLMMVGGSVVADTNANYNTTKPFNIPANTRVIIDCWSAVPICVLAQVVVGGYLPLIEDDTPGEASLSHYELFTDHEIRNAVCCYRINASPVIQLNTLTGGIIKDMQADIDDVKADIEDIMTAEETSPTISIGETGERLVLQPSGAVVHDANANYNITSPFTIPAKTRLTLQCYASTTIVVLAVKDGANYENLVADTSGDGAPSLREYSFFAENEIQNVVCCYRIDTTPSIAFTTITGGIIEDILNVGISNLKNILLKYKGKKISILGDSISTYGTPGATNEDGTYCYSYYPTATCRYSANGNDSIQFDVNNTYWMKLIKHLQASLGINESWRGTLVTGSNNGNELNNQVRINHLGENGTPDVILVFGGTNDAGNSVPIGEFNTENPADYTDAQIAALPVSTFADAYRAMLIRLMKTYPQAELVVLLPTFTISYYPIDRLDNYVEIIKEACDFFGIKYIDLRTTKINVYNKSSFLVDGIHPNVAGMALLEDLIYRKMLFE